MKKLLLIALLTVSAAMCFAVERHEVWLMTYNIHNGIGMDNVTDYGRIGRFIRDCEYHVPDIVAIQEVDSATTRSHGRYVLGEIAAECGMKEYFAPAINYSGGKYGVGILCHDEPLSIRRIPLPGREEARVLLVAEFDDYIFACTHLSLTEEDRMASIDILVQESKRSTKPFILAGDFNAEPDSEFIEALRGRFTLLSDVTGHTYPADEPTETIDYLMAYHPKTTWGSSYLTTVFPESVMSDHRPILTKYVWEFKEK